MIKLHTKIIKSLDDSQLVELKKYKHKHTTTAEHILAIGVLVDGIMGNDKDMSITRLCKIIKSNYENSKKE